MIDPRGTRFAAAVTSAVLIVVLVTGSLWVLAAQAAVFAIAAAKGPARSPYGIVYATLVRPRLKPPTVLEPPAPPRFAQAVGLAFALAGLLAMAAGASVIGYAAVSAALVAAFLNAAFGLCLGCEIYLAFVRVVHKDGRDAREPARSSVSSPAQPNTTEVHL